MSEFLAAVIEASREIIPQLLAREPHLLESSTQGAGGDISIGADLLCERIFCDHLLHLAHIDSEESGFIPSSRTAQAHTKTHAQNLAQDTTPTIILDPLDGSDNYLSHIPYFGASLALCDTSGEVLEAAIVNYATAEIVYDSVDFGVLESHQLESYEPTALESTKAKSRELDSSAWASTSFHTSLNARRIRVFPLESPLLESPLLESPLLESPLLESFPQDSCAPIPLANTTTHISREPKCGVFEKAYCYPHITEQLYAHHYKFRSLGASALSLAYATQHRFFIFGGSIRRYDAKAGLFLCRNLFIAYEQDFLLVSQNKQVFGMIKHILWGEKHAR